MLEFELDLTNKSTGWVHRSAGSTKSRGCEAFNTNEECTHVEVSNIDTTFIIMEWKLPSDVKTPHAEKTFYAQV